MKRSIHIAKVSLALSVIAILLLPYLHPFVGHIGHDHGHEHEHCTAELEQDQCHRMLVHHDSSAHCEHDGHVTGQEESCDLCDGLITRIQSVINEASSKVEFRASELTFGSIEMEVFVAELFGCEGRGPPHHC